MNVRPHPSPLRQAKGKHAPFWGVALPGIFGVAICLSAAFALATRADNTAPVFSSVVSWQLPDLVAVSPAVSYVFYEQSGTSPDTPLVSQVVSYQFHEWPGNLDSIAGSSLPVSYLYNFPGSAGLVSHVIAFQNSGTPLVDMFYDLSGTGTSYFLTVSVSTDGGATFSVPATHFTGDGVSSPTAPGTGKHIVWDAGADLGPGYFPNVVLRVSADGPPATSSIFPVNLRGLDGGLKVTGQVVDGATGKAVAGALVQLDSESATSDAQGHFAFPAVAVGDYTLSVSKTGYAAASATVSVTPGSAPSRVIALSPSASPGSAPRVTSVTSKYSGFRYFLDGAAFPIVGFPVTYTAQVDWAGHPPGAARFLTPRRTYTVTVSNSTASQVLDMSSDFGPNGRLRVAVVSSDGTQSVEKLADFLVVPSPFPMFPSLAWGVEDQGSSFSYNTSFDTTIFDQGVTDKIIPQSIPVFGDKALKVEFIPAVEVAVNSDGTATVTIKWDNLEIGKLLKAHRKNHGLRSLMNFMSDLVDEGRIDRRHLPHQPFGGLDLTLYPELGGGWKYAVDAGQWQWNDAFAGLGADLSVSQTWPFLIGFVPLYFRAKAELTVDATAHLLQLSPLSLAGEVDVNPSLRGSLGVGISELLAAEGWVEGGARIEIPQPPAGPPASLYLKAGATIYYLIGHQDYSGLVWSWPSEGVLHTRQVVLHEIPWRPLGREYLQFPSQGILARSARVRRMDNRRGGSPDILLSPVFPYSDPNCFARGTNLDLVFVADNTNRTSMNRTLALFTQFDGANWSQPTPIADDGTADFHPRLLSFPDGTMVVAWENEGALLPDTATLDAMKANLEVSAAWFDPKTGGWSPAWQATTNGFLDRSPKLAGRSQDNVLLTWIANPANDENGSPTAPNQIWSARWNGNAWSAPQLAATITNAVLKYDLAYDGTTANLVLSVDTVSGATDVHGHELLRLAYQNGNWGPLTQLTADQVPDDNPQTILDSQGKVVLTWLKGDELSSVVDFAMTNRQVLRTNEYSSNLADFKLAASAGGRLALLWAEPSENDSDLFAMFYDPAAQVWGAPKQLTRDPETERGMTAAFFGEKELVAVYNRTLVSSTNALGTSVTDLAALVSPLGEDLALDGSRFYSDPANPSPGGSATLRLRVLNLGDQAETDVVVAFYQGAVGPESELGRASLTNGLPPQAASEVTFTWPVAATNGTTTVFAVVDPDQKVADATRSNNVARLDLVKPNLGIQSASWSLVASNLVAVTVRVGNDGVVDAEPATVSLRQDSATGTDLFSQDLPTLAPGESEDASFVWSVAGLPHDLNVVAVLSGSGLANNFSTAKLTADLAIDLTTPPRLEDCHYLSDGSFQLTVLSEPGRSYAVQSSTNLIDWIPVTTFVSTNATTTIVDPTADKSPYRFYRAVIP